MTIAYNNTTAAFEYTDASGAVLFSSPNMSYLKEKVRLAGLPLDGTTVAPVVTGQVRALTCHSSLLVVLVLVRHTLSWILFVNKV